jgi:cell division protein ZapA (FtsZ GTPase activity inhibitor)
MPILEINILGSKIGINYQKDEKDKLIRLIEQFKLRLSELENLKGRFSDNKIIFLAALKVEDDIFELKKTLNNQKKTIDSLDAHRGKIDDKIREIINLKDQVSSLNKNNIKLEEQNANNMKEFEKLNKKLIAIMDKIFNTNNNNA